MAVNVPINFFANVDDAAKEFSKLTTVLKGVAAAFAVSKIVDGIEKVASAAADAEEQSHKMSMALRLAGDYSEQNVAAFEALAAQMQENTKYDGDFILSQIAIAKQFNTTNEEAAKLVQAAADLAAATGQDLPSAVQLLGKSLDGTAGRLTELVPGMRALTQEELTAGAAIDIIAKRFKGAAEGELNTFNGMMAKLKNNFGDFLESIGDVIIKNDAVKDTVKLVSEGLRTLTEVIRANHGVISSWLTGGISFVLKLFAALADVIYEVEKPILILSRDLADLFRRILSIPELVNAVIGDIAKGDLGFSKFKAQTDALQKAFEADDQAGLALLNTYKDISANANSVAKQMDNLAASQAKVAESTEKTTKGFDRQVPAQKRLSAEILTMYKTLEQQSREFGLTQEETVNKRIQKELVALENVILKEPALREQALKVSNALSLKYDKERRDARLQDIQKELGDLQKIAAQPIAFALEIDEATFNSTGLGKNLREAITAGLGAVGSILQGKEGAKKLLGGFAEQMGKAFLGVPGMGAIFEALSAGPEQVRTMVTEFANAIPDLLSAVIESIPVVIETLAENLDEIVIKLVDKLAARAPDIAIAIAKAVAITLPIALMKASAGFVAGIISSVGKWIDGVKNAVGQFASGAVQFIGKIIEGAGQFVGKILEGAVEFVGKIIEGAGKAFQNLIPGGGGALTGPGGGFGISIGGGNTQIGIGTGGIQLGPVGIRFAEGGMVPPGYPNDTFPSMLSSGEIVVPRDSSAKLMAFLDREASGGGSAAAVERVLASQERNLTVNISVGEADLAKVLLNLNRRGFRTA